MAAVILSVALAAALVIAVVLALWGRALRSGRAEATARANGAEAKVAAGQDRETALQEYLDAADEQRRTLEARLGEQEAAAADAEDDRRRLRGALAERVGELEQLTGERARLATDLDAAKTALRAADDAVATAIPASVLSGLWALERARTERTWRQSVVVGPPEGSPFDGPVDALRVAVEVEAAALREDVGSVVTTDWRLPGALSEATSLLILRAAQELLAAASRTVDEATLVAEQDEAEVVLWLGAPDGTPIDLESVLDGVTVPGLDLSTCELRLPFAPAS